MTSSTSRNNEPKPVTAPQEDRTTWARYWTHWYNKHMAEAAEAKRLAESYGASFPSEIGYAAQAATGKAGSTPARSQRSGETGGRFDSGVVDSGEPKARPASGVRLSAESGDQSISTDKYSALEFAAKHFEAYGVSHMQFGKPWTGIQLAEVIRACMPSAEGNSTDAFVLREIAECEALAEGQKEFLRRKAAECIPLLETVKQCSTCAYWLRRGASDTGRCLAANGWDRYDSITLESDGCKDWKPDDECNRPCAK
jgi:hypothetical protein